MTQRRKRGEGTIEARGDGAYRIRIPRGIGHDGKRLSPYEELVYGTEDGAELARQRAHLAIREGRRAESSSMTLAAWVETWLRERAGELAARTIASYRQVLADHVLPARIDGLGSLGAAPLSRITGRHVEALMRALARPGARADGKAAGAPLSANTRLHAYRYLSACLQEAVYRGLLTLNPVRQARAPRVDRREARSYDDIEARRLLVALEAEPLWFQAFVGLALYTGMRRGEIIALEWRHLDLDAGRLRVEQAAQYVGGVQTAKVPKTASSRRAVTLPPEVVDTLQLWRAAQMVEGMGRSVEANAPSWVFTDAAGRWMLADHVTTAFARFIARHGLPPLPLHGLRHTFVTLLIKAGVDVRTIASMAGHASSTTTLTIYAHPIASARQAASSALADILRAIRDPEQSQ